MKKENQQGNKEVEHPVSVSYYRCICEALDKNGCLPRDFCLPKKGKPESKLHFADGAVDGMKVYHMGSSKVDIAPLCEVVRLASQEQYVQAEQLLQSYFAGDDWMLMLSCIDEVQKWIVDNKQEINPNRLYRFATTLLFESCDAESIKFAISVFELLDVEDDEKIHEALLHLARSDEFTLFVLFALYDWQDANAQRFDIAQKVYSWGRIHAIDRLEPETREMEEWLLTEGFQNDVLPEYSALTCIQKGKLLERLQQNSLSPSQTDNIHSLLRYALQGGPVASIESDAQGEELVAAYLVWLDGIAPTTQMRETLDTLQNILPDWNWSRKKELLEQCNLQKSKLSLLEQ